MINVMKILATDLSDPAHSIAAARELEKIIEARWLADAHEMHTEVSLEKIREHFAGAESAQYEFMPTKLGRAAVHGGIGRLLIGFPEGAEEQDRLHMHPGGRIVVALMDNAEFYSPEPGRSRKMNRGSVILMPAMTPHNFRSLGERHAGSAKTATVEDILDGKVPGTVFLAIHVGYVDVHSPDAIIYVP